MDIHRSALVRYSAREMYRLVRDVDAYPDFLSWCSHSEVHEQTDQQQLATLTIEIAGLTRSFTTRNRLVPSEQIALSLVDGPFQRLAGEWQFQPLGEDGSKVSLALRFDMAQGLVSQAFGRGFAHVADHLLQDFVTRADELHG